MERQKSFQVGIMEKQLSIRSRVMEKQQSFKLGGVEKQQNLNNGLMEKQKSFRGTSLERQRSFRLQNSFRQKKSKDNTGKRGDTPLHLASRVGDLVKIHEILEEGDSEHLQDLLCKKNQDGETALYVAADNGHTEVVREILKYSDAQSAAIKANGNFDAFHVASKEGHIEVLKELLHTFPELAMTTNSVNSTALDTAATQGHIDVVNLLLETTDLAKIARSNGKTVLHSAARSGHVEVVKSLLSKDPTIGFRTDRKGQTAFHMAVKGRNIEIVHELLKPDPSIIILEDNKGNTALHIATRKGHLEMVQNLLLFEGSDVNALNKAGETALDIADKSNNEQISAMLKEAGGLPAKDHANPPSPAKQLKMTVSDIKHDVHSQLHQTRQTGLRVHKIKRKLKKLHIGGLNNAINSNTVVAVLIATVAFAAIFTLPAESVETKTPGYSLGQAYIAKSAPFIVFFIFDSLALFISLSVVVVQTSLIVTEQKSKTQMVSVINKLMWLACLFISVAFVSLTFIVVGRHDLWLAWATTAIGASIMLTSIGSMCYCIIRHRMRQKSNSMVQRASRSQSRSWSVLVDSDSELLTGQLKMYPL